MDYAKILRPFFAIAFIGIIYFIIILALRIMYKDVKNGDKKKLLKKYWGLEILNAGENQNLKTGAVIPIRRELTIGRKDVNLLILSDPFVSGHHTKIYLKNTDYFIEDLGSTNGTVLNHSKLEGKKYLYVGDEIKIGSAFFRVIG